MVLIVNILFPATTSAITIIPTIQKVTDHIVLYRVTVRTSETHAMKICKKRMLELQPP